MLAAKFKLQYNKTVKSLQFRKLYRLENESADEYYMWQPQSAILESWTGN